MYDKFPFILHSMDKNSIFYEKIEFLHRKVKIFTLGVTISCLTIDSEKSKTGVVQKSAPNVSVKETSCSVASFNRTKKCISKFAPITT